MSEPLSKKQMEVLALVAIGRTNEEIARVLGNTPATIKNHVIQIIRRLDAFNRMNAVWKAMALGIIPPPKVPDEPARVVRNIEAKEIVPEPGDAPVVHRWRDVEVCTQLKTVRVGGGQAQHVRKYTALMVKHFLEHPNRVYSREQLIDACWGTNVFIEERCVDLYVRFARIALGMYGQRLMSERGLGYKFTTEGL